MKPSVTFEQDIEGGGSIDVHKKVIETTIKGTDIKETTKTYNSFTESIEEMRD